MSTTLRDIITEDQDVEWIAADGETWDATELLAQWGDDLDRPASCVAGHVHWIGADGYIETGTPVLREKAPLSDNGQYAVFQAGDGWHFEPNQALNPFEGETDYSPAWDTRADALDAANEQEAEDAREVERWMSTTTARLDEDGRLTDEQVAEIGGAIYEAVYSRHAPDDAANEQEEEDAREIER